MSCVMNGAMKEFKVTAQGKISLIEADMPDAPLGAEEVEGHTLYSLVSPGTELAVFQGLANWAQFPCGTGYASVFKIDSVGSEVEGMKVGDLVFCKNQHKSWQRCKAADAVKVPEGLAPEVAVFCRMMGVSMSTLVTTRARPPYTVIVTGLGLVGNLAAQMFNASGYRVIACDPVGERRELAQRCGLSDVRALVPLDDESIAGKVSLVVECSGHEQAVLDACKVVKKGGEVVMIGVPWSKRTDIPAFDILHAVFHKYVHLRSGWEWELPWTDQDFREGSIMGNYEGALRWLAEGRINTGVLAEKRSPEDVADIYNNLVNKKNAGLTTLVEW
ncbi:MAG: zinc-binding alcohol dehydrogenase [Planctomycetes bacterium]|nr:zinc-binding alcohol dehydrogenase [Planctomycetota bacterium]